MAAVEASLVPETPGPDVTIDPPSNAPPATDAAPASTTPPGEEAVPPDSAPAVPEADKPKDPAVTDPADPPAPGDDKPDARPSDEFGELPKDAKQETRERFDAIKGKFDEVAAERDQAVDVASRWHETIQATGATPQQIQGVFEALTYANSGTPEGLRKYHDALLAELAPVAKLLGLPAPGFDPLSDHPDLAERVENEELTAADALELVQARASRKLTEVASTQRDTTTHQQQVEQQGMDAVRALGNQFRTANPAEFDAKLPFITPMIDAVIARLPPDKWVESIKDAYAKLPTPAPAAARAPIIPPAIRPGPGGAAGGGGMDKKPGSVLEAMDLALRVGG